MKKTPVIILSGFFVLSLLLSSCGSDSKSGGSTVKSETKISQSGALNNSKNDSLKGSTDKKSAESQSKIIKKAYLTITTDKFDSSIKNINEALDKCGGYIESSNIDESKENSTRVKFADLTLRIPKDKLDSFLNSSGNFGRITNKKITGEDVSETYYDKSARLKALTTEEERLLQLIRDSKDLANLLQVEKELSNTRYEIEKITGELKHLDNVIDYSSVTINLSETSAITEARSPLLNTLNNVLKGSLNVLISLVRGIFIVITALLPFIPIFIIIYIVIRLVRKKKGKKENKN